MGVGVDAARVWVENGGEGSPKNFSELFPEVKMIQMGSDHFSPASETVG